MAQARTAERPPLPVIVAFNVWRLRTSREPKWSQEKLAREASLSRNTIAAVEDARDGRSDNALRLDTLEAIANALAVDPGELLLWDRKAMKQMGWTWEPAFQLPLSAVVGA